MRRGVRRTRRGVEAGTSPPHGAADPPGTRDARDRVVAAGLVIAVAAVAAQTVLHLLNAAFLDSPELDANAEENVFTWASSATIFGAAFAASLRAFAVPSVRARFFTLAAIFAFFSLDEAVSVHERVALHVVDLLDLPSEADSVVWPVVYLPLLITASILLLRVARSNSARAGRLLLVGLGLLALAVVAEEATAPWSTSERAAGWGHAIEGAFEEGAELGGWILIATGLAAVALTEIVERAVSRE
jgi:hypothetical protein